MGRPKEFDPGVALDRAMHLFWEQGFEATSMQDLVEAMGVNRGSLYSTFGNKEKLYQAAMSRYCDSMMGGILDQLGAPGDPKEILRSFFEMVVDGSMAEGPSKGCFMTNSAVELGPHCSRTADKVAANQDRLEQALCSLAERADLKGNKPRAIARFLSNTLTGLSVAAKRKPAREELQDIVDVALSIFD
jgi:TetR/AcrR family transcriptional regulator, transcriptional repressor for nem operon